VVNQVQREYNSFQQLTREYQEHGGAVDTSTSIYVDYLYADGSANTSRRAGCVYPNGRNVSYHTANPVNEITDITNTTGDAWSQPGYDAAGNMTTIPQPADMTSSYVATYDAWNRLTKLVDATTSLVFQENQYDGMNRRVIRHNYGSGFATETRHFYYSDNWQVLEERVDDATYTPDRQFVWGLRYIDDLILRDRSFGDTLDERLYVLQDANWNVIGFCNDIGAMQQRIAYSPYGLPTWLNIFFDGGGDDFQWETLFCGYRWDGSTAFYCVRMRYFNARLGFWTKYDPLPQKSRTSYGYVNSRLTILLDPTGLIIISHCPIGEYLGKYATGNGHQTNANEWTTTLSRGKRGAVHYGLKSSRG
jgi:RHS repeat-associated protein